MTNSSFKFKLLDIVPFVKGDNKLARVICYCSYGFLVTIFCNEDKSNLLKQKSLEKDFDMTNFVNVYFDSRTQKFVYTINIK